MKKINLVLLLIGIISFNPTLAINKVFYCIKQTPSKDSFIATIFDKRTNRVQTLFPLLHLLERDGSVAVVVELLDDRLDLLHRQVLPGQLQLTLVTNVYLQLFNKERMKILLIEFGFSLPLKFVHRCFYPLT